MLSQRPEDLPDIAAVQNTRSLQDIPGWVRSTHIERLPRLMQRLFKDTDVEGALDDILVQRALNIAQAHGTWPWDWQKFSFVDKDSGLAAMLAVADLLDEDALRCDSSTLLRHRYGTPLNCAHWIRHGLTVGRVLVREGNVAVRFGRPPRTDAQMEPVFAALRNHYRLVKLYVKDLGHVMQACSILNSIHHQVYRRWKFLTWNAGGNCRNFASSRHWSIVLFRVSCLKRCSMKAGFQRKCFHSFTTSESLLLI
jgi:hypothetical protein